MLLPRSRVIRIYPSPRGDEISIAMASNWHGAGPRMLAFKSNVSAGITRHIPSSSSPIFVETVSLDTHACMELSFRRMPCRMIMYTYMGGFRALGRVLRCLDIARMRSHHVCMHYSCARACTESASKWHFPARPATPPRHAGPAPAPGTGRRMYISII